MAVDRLHSNTAVRHHSIVGHRWKFIGDFDADTESTYANNYECVSTEFGRVGHTAGGAVHAIYTYWHIVARLCVWGAYVQTVAVFAR